jgi:hypothetical protein
MVSIKHEIELMAIQSEVTTRLAEKESQKFVLMPQKDCLLSNNISFDQLAKELSSMSKISTLATWKSKKLRISRYC